MEGQRAVDRKTLLLQGGENAFIVGITVLFFLTRILKTDDGWIAMNIDYFIQSGKLVNVPLSQDLFFGRGLVFSNSLLPRIVGFNYFTIVLVQLFVVVVSTISIGKLTSRLFGVQYRFIGEASFMLFGLSSGILLSTRPEAIYSGLLVIQLLCLSDHILHHHNKGLVIAAVCAGIAPSFHPNGVVLVGIFALYLLIAGHSGRLRGVEVGGTIALLMFLVWFTFFYGNSWEDIVGKINATLAFMENYHTDSRFLEPMRYTLLLGKLREISPLFLLAGLGLLWLYKDYFQGNLSLSAAPLLIKLIVFSSLGNFLYLFLVKSKTDYYLALQFVFFVLGLAYLLSKKLIHMPVATMNVVLTVLLLETVTVGLTHNEHFLQMLHLHIDRVHAVEEVSMRTKGDVVLAPIRCFLMFRGASRFISSGTWVKPKRLDEGDWVVAYVLEGVKRVEKELHVQLSFEQGFVYNENAYNLFKVVRKSGGKG